MTTPLRPEDRLTPEKRFWAKVDKLGPVPEWRPDLGPCWLWTASQQTEGYGQVTINYKVQRAHRVAYRWLVGPIPDGLQLDHLCRVRACVNPGHLEPVTNRENARRSPLIGGWQRRITHCPQGHPYDEVNTYRHRGQRMCRTCRKSTPRRRAVA